MSKTRFAVLAALLALAAPVHAAETYTFDKAHTNVGFQVRHIFTLVSGKFTDFAGTIQVDRAKPESSTVEFTIQAKIVAQAGDHMVEAKLHYQACDANACLPPKTITVPIDVIGK